MATSRLSLLAHDREGELLLCAARTRMDETSGARLRALLESNLDWQRVLRMAERHGLIPLLYKHLKAIAQDNVPSAVMRQLHDYFLSNAARNLLLATELEEVLKLLRAEGIPVLSFKGAELAKAAYGDVTLRCFTDIDVLIKRGDLSRATEVLLARGYGSPFRMSMAHEASYLERKGEQLFIRSDADIQIDLHWAFAPHYVVANFNAERFINPQDSELSDDSLAPALSIEDLLLVLCVHNGRGFWQRLAWVCDIAELLAKQQRKLNWPQLIARAKTDSVLRMLLLGLSLAHELLSAPLPKEIQLMTQKDEKLKALATRVQQRLFETETSETRITEFYLFDLKIRERLRDALRYGLYLTLPPTPADWEAVALPESLRALYYAIRLSRLIKGGARQLKLVSR